MRGFIKGVAPSTSLSFFLFLRKYLGPYGENCTFLKKKWLIIVDSQIFKLYCGRFAVMQIRLRNDGGETGYVTLPGAVAVNGGTPISYYWLSSTEPENGKVAIAPDEVGDV